MLHLLYPTYFKNLIEGMPNGIIIFNTNGEAYAVNSKAAGLLNISKDTCIGKHWKDILSPLTPQDIFCDFMETVFATQKKLEALSVRLPGKHNDLHLSLRASYLMEYGKTFGISLAINDVTSIYQMHAKEKRLLEERHTLQQERVEGMRKLSMSLAHQIRNPITSIAGFANILLNKTPSDADPAFAEYLHYIIESAQRLEDVVKAVGEYTSNVQISSIVPVDPEDVLLQAKEKALQRRASHKNPISWEISSHSCSLLSDPDMLTEALTETICNSLESFNGKGGKIQLTAFARNGFCCLEVNDDGNGIPRQNLPFIFDPFFTTKSIGVGMGLSKAHRIIKELGGSMDIKSDPGNGTRVRFQLKRTD